MHGTDRDRAGTGRAVGGSAATACGACSASRIFHPPAARAHDFEALAAAILKDLGNRSPASFRVSATRADKRLPFTSPQVEREVGGLIKQATGWRVDLDRSGTHDSCRNAARRRLLFFRQGARRGRPADRNRRPGRVPAVGGHRFARRGLSDDATRLFGAVDSFPRLSDPVARITGKSAGDRGAADAIPASIAAAARPVRRAAAAGRARRPSRPARRRLPAADAAHRRAAGAHAGGRARW